MLTEAGRVYAEDLRPGDRLDTPDGWKPVVSVGRKTGSSWIVIDCGEGERLIVTASHVFYKSDGSHVHADKLALGMFLKAAGGHKRVIGLELMETVEDMVILEMEEPHLYYAGEDKLLSHNSTQKP